jgi:predicted nicotinamide N-methyase
MIDRTNPSRWLPENLDVIEDRIPLGRIAPRLLRVRDPGALIDSVDSASFGVDERFPYWSEVWPSSVAMGRFLARGNLLSGIDAVELGCGTGLAGVAAALMGARVTFTDFEPAALSFARANHHLNLGRPGKAALFDWRDPPRKINARLALGSDVLYEARFLGPFVNTLHRVLLPGSVALVAEPGRRIAEGSVEKLEEAGFSRSLHLEEFDYAGRRHSVWIHILRKRGRR